MVLLLAIGVAIVAATTGIAGRANSAARETAERDNAGRIVEVEDDENTGRSGRLTASTLARIKSLEGVRGVYPASEVPIGIKTDDIPGVLLTATTLQTSRPPMIHPKGAVPQLKPGEVLLPDSAQGSALAPLIGSEQEFETQR